MLDPTRLWLEGAGHRVSEAANGHQAQERLHETEYDLLITDLAMPDMDGIELILDIKKLSPNQKILVMSGFRKNGKGFLRAAESLGADGAIRKPLEQESFIHTVESMLVVDGQRV